MILKQPTQQKTIIVYNHSISEKIHQNMSAAGIDCQSSDFQICNYHRSVDYLHNRYRLSSVFGALTSRVTLLWFTQHGCTCHSQSVTLQMSQRAITEVLTMSTTGID